MENQNKPLTTKDNVRKLASDYNCETKYQGEKRIMFIIGPNAQEFIEYIQSQYCTAFTMEVGVIKKEEVV